MFANTCHPRPSLVTPHVASVPAGAQASETLRDRGGGPACSQSGREGGPKKSLLPLATQTGLKYARAVNYEPNEIKPAAICSYQREVGGWDLISLLKTSSSGPLAVPPLKNATSHNAIGSGPRDRSMGAIDGVHQSIG